ncbi:MAG: SDR family NAD(P)-dependent oxidoreductase [Rhodobacteraceae bacterium]|nr:SDR family NAD(P)-dependent oxidoreductase [Paracoccaceae bacterium]
MENALIIGASGGIGQALTRALKARGTVVRTLSRSADGFDVTQPEAATAMLDAIETRFDLVLVATGALVTNGHRPEKRLVDLSAQAMMDQFALNTVGPALVLSRCGRLLPRDRPAVCATLSARVGSIGDNRLGGWYSYRAAKAAVNQVIHTAAIELARTHPLLACVALHPGTVATPLTKAYANRHPTVSPDTSASNLLSVIDGLSATDTGKFFDWRGEPIPW